jgi:hypothetical protein
LRDGRKTSFPKRVFDMALIEIKQFRCYWRPSDNRGEFQLELANRAMPTLAADSPAEFAAIMAILNESPVFLETADGSIHLKPGPVGGD